MKLFYYHKIFVQHKLLLLKLDDCQETLCVYQLVSLLHHTDQEKEEKSQFFITLLHALQSSEFSSKHVWLWSREKEYSRERRKPCQESQTLQSFQLLIQCCLSQLFSGQHCNSKMFKLKKESQRNIFFLLPVIFLSFTQSQLLPSQQNT